MSTTETITVRRDVNAEAKANAKTERERLAERGTFVINLLSSPGEFAFDRNSRPIKVANKSRVVVAVERKERNMVEPELFLFKYQAEKSQGE